MMFARAIVASIVLGLAATAHADDTGNFVVQLGRDTTSVETFTRSANRLEIDQLGRAPRLLRRHFVYDFKDGSLTRFSMVVTPPGATAPSQTITATRSADSLQMEVRTGSAPPQNTRMALPAGTVVVANSSPWSTYEGLIMKLVRSKAEEIVSPLYFVSAPAPLQLRVRKVSPDTVELANDRGDIFRVRIDKQGRIQAVTPVAGTGKFSVTRVRALDMNAVTAGYAAREKSGGGLGVLSPRDTVRVANAGGASLWVDYGRPHKRDRVVFGGVVPWGEIWRTGANAATQFRTDKALDFGAGIVVPPGFYSLWTIPSVDGWKLIVNGETGQWGTEHKPEKDLFTIALQVGTLPQPVEAFTISIDPTAQGGVLKLDWDTTRASAAFTVAP